MRSFLLTRARLAFWLWCIPAFVWLLCTLPAEASPTERMAALAALCAWILFGWVGIQFYSQRQLKIALQELDDRCDPQPLLELCTTVCRQNPDSLLFQVYRGYALALLGRDREALEALDRVADHPRLAKNPLTLLVWSSALPSGHPKQDWAAARLTALRPRMRPRQQALVDQVLNQRQSFTLMQAAPPQLEPILRQNLERAGCRREQVGAHMALAVYCHQRQDWAQCQRHLEFVLEHANKLHVRTQAEELMCKLPPLSAPDGI